MLSVKQSSGRPTVIPTWAVVSLKLRLEQPEGFKSYIQVQQWLCETLGIEAEYRTVHELVRYRLKAKLKAARPVHTQQDTSALDAFNKNLSSDLELLKQYTAGLVPSLSRIRYFCQDESRFGLKTLVGRLITALGTKPLAPWQWQLHCILAIWSRRTVKWRAFLLAIFPR